MKNFLILLIFGAISLVGGYLLLNDSGGTQPAQTGGGADDINVDMSMSPDTPEAGETAELTFSFTDENGDPVSNLMKHHARRVHVLIIDEERQTVGHIHPVDFSEETQEGIASGVYTVEYAFPHGGDYLVGVDVMNDVVMKNELFNLSVEGAPAEDVRGEDFATTKCFTGVNEQAVDRYIDPIAVSEMTVDCPSGYEVTIEPSVRPIQAGDETFMRFSVQRGGEPVTDLNPYLDAALHLAIVSDDMSQFIHSHGTAESASGNSTEPMEMDTSVSMEGGSTMDESSGSMSMMEMMNNVEVPESFGPTMLSEAIVFPEPGVYTVFSQFKHNDKIVTGSFDVVVE